MLDIRKSIVVRLAGGLGNQLFQFGMALLLSSKETHKVIVLDDYALSTYKANRSFELSRFIDFSRSDIQIILQRRLLTKLRIPRILTFKSHLSPFVSDNNFIFLIDFKKSQYRFLDGYFQNLRQRDFDGIVALLKLLSFNRLTKSISSDCEACVIHIRGGDFVGLGWNQTTSRQYYMDAMNVMHDRYKVKRFLLVTDDKNYAKNLISSTNFNIEILSNSIDEDFWTIASYSKRILSASTFSLWASALGRNYAGGVVIAPKYFTPTIKRNFSLQNEVVIPP